jgi:putative tryptophan/tyrosine transport system substrate-binding protein
MRRREFIAIVMAAAAKPIVGRAQASDHLRRIAVLFTTTQDDPETKLRLAAFTKGLEALGWIEGRTHRIESHYAGGEPDAARRDVAEVVREGPDVILSVGQAILVALRQETRSIPIVFVLVIDPVGEGFVASLARPGGNLTGFTNFEGSMAGKWLEILKEVAPSVTQVALLFNPQSISKYFSRSIDSAKTRFQIEITDAAVRSAEDVEQTIASLARRKNAGLIVLPDLFTAGHHELIVSIANRHRVPAIYPYRYFTEKGGVLSYGLDTADVFRRASDYVVRILRGEKPADLPVQAPNKFELVINLKAAKALGITVPPSLLIAADEVIE